MNQKGNFLIAIILIIIGIYWWQEFPRVPLPIPKEDLISIEEAKTKAQKYLSRAVLNKTITLNDKINTWYSVEGLPIAYIFYGKTEDERDSFLVISALKKIPIPFYCGGSGISPEDRYDEFLETHSYQDKRYLFFGNPMCIPYLELTGNNGQKSYYLFGLSGAPNVSRVSKKFMFEQQEWFLKHYLNGYKNSAAQPLTGKCGDGICDNFERTRASLCPRDCVSEKSTESSGSQKPVAAPIGKCGDNICDNFEKANPGACSTDCGSENTEKISPIIANVTVDYAKELGGFSPYVFGAIASPYFSSKGYELSKDAGFKIIGINAPSVPQDPNDPKQYDFSEIDQSVKAAINNGLEPLIIFFTDNKKPSDLDAYGIYAQNVAKHLTQGWNSGYNYEIKVFRFGNEPDNFGFWQDTQENWFAMYVAWAKALKSVNKNFILDGLALMSPRVGSDGGLPSFDDTDKISGWITNFLAYVKKNDAYVDLVSIHAYAPFPYFSFYDNYRLLSNELRKYPNLSNIYGTPRAANDEWNLLLGDFWSGFYAKQFDTSWAASGRINSLISMIEQGVWLSIPMFGTFNDARDGKGEGGCHDFLLVDCNAHGKPSYYAFKGFNQLADTNRLEATGTDHVNLAVIAGKRNNEVIIIISNHDTRAYKEKYEDKILDGKSPAPKKPSPAWFEYNAYVAKYGEPKVYNKYTLTLNNLPWSPSDQVTYERYIVDDNKKLELTETKTIPGGSTLTFTKDISAPSVEVVKVYVK